MTEALETIRILDVDGKITPTAAAEPYLAQLQGLDPEFWLDAYRHMRFVRAFDRESTNLQRQGQLALYVPVEGQEAAQVGSTLASRPQDRLFPSYREHAVLKVREVDLVNILALMRGVTNGGWNPDDHNVQNYCLVIGSQTLHATGYAMGQVFDGVVGTGDPEVDAATIAYFGDGATSQGDTNEALIFAKSYNAPVVFFLQNNHWAISVPVTVQSPTPLANRGLGFGMPSVQIDGNDVMASYAVTRTMLDRARGGEGPAFIEALTYRMGAHTTSDDPTKYRTSDEEALWRARDPIARLRSWLEANDVDAATFDEIDSAAADFASDIRTRTLALPDPHPLEMFEFASTELDPAVERDRDAYLAFEASFGEGDRA